MAEPDERPIPFNGAMVRATLAGHKTQTRRVLKAPTPEAVTKISGADPYTWRAPTPGYFHWRPVGAVWAVRELGGPTFIRCPYGAVGDHLWVRERMRVIKVGALTSGPVAVQVRYEADGAKSKYISYPERLKAPPVLDRCLSYGGYREASRITLEVTGIRVERLQDISEDDAKAEGLHCLTKDGGTTYKYGIGCAREGWPGSGRKDDGWKWTDWDEDPRMAFAFLWDSINADRGFGWETNPFVWCVDFKLLERR